MTAPRPDADAELYARYRPPVYDLLARRLGNLEEAEALTQEALMRALEAARHQEVRSFGAFVMRIAHNLATDALRRRRFEGPWVDAEQALVVTVEPEQAELSRLRRAVDELPDKLEHIIELRYVQGLSFAEIALALDMSKNGVFARHERALDLLRDAFARRRT